MSDRHPPLMSSRSFAEAVRNFAGVPPKRFAVLLPHRDGIAELRQKGASFGMIREILAMAGIEVAADTVRRFYRDVIEEPRSGAKRSPRRERAARSAATRHCQYRRRVSRLSIAASSCTCTRHPRHHAAAARASLIHATFNPATQLLYDQATQPHHQRQRRRRKKLLRSQLRAGVERQAACHIAPRTLTTKTRRCFASTPTPNSWNIREATRDRPSVRTA